MDRIDFEPETAPPTSRAGVHADLDEGIRHEASLIIMKPAAEIYRFWRELENLPRFMFRLESISVNSPTLSHWKYKALKNTVHIEWDSEITQDVPGSTIAWKSLDGTSVSHTGSVVFEELPFKRGTKVTVELSYNPPGGKLTDFLQKLVGENPESTLREDLRHLRNLLEAGEIPTIEGQPHGGRKKEPSHNPALHH